MTIAAFRSERHYRISEEVRPVWIGVAHGGSLGDWP